MADVVLTVTYFAFLLGFGVILANVLKKYKIPDTFFLLLLGLVLGPTVFMNPIISGVVNLKLVDAAAMGSVPDFLRLLALILIVFTGTFNMGFRIFKKHYDISLRLAFGGAIVNTVLLGLAAHFIFGFDWLFALLLGGILCGTSSGVVFYFEDRLCKHKKALNVLKLESVFNAPLTVLLPIMFLGLIIAQPGGVIEPMKYISQGWQMIAAGVGTGIIVGFGVAKLLKSVMKEYKALLLLSIALITYALAENIGGSGMLAVAICGFIAGEKIMKDREITTAFDDQLTEMLRISVLTLLGTQVALFIGIQDALMMLAFFFVALLIRPAFVFLLAGRDRRGFDRGDMSLLGLVAPRGVDSAAIAPIVASALVIAGAGAVSASIMNIVFVFILLSVLASTVAAIKVSSISPFQKAELPDSTEVIMPKQAPRKRKRK